MGESASAFDLSTNGDQAFVFCLDADDQPNFLWGISYNGPWLNASLEDDAYGEGGSALPSSLQVTGSLALNNETSCVYAGELGGTRSELQAFFMGPHKIFIKRTLITYGYH